MHENIEHGIQIFFHKKNTTFYKAHNHEFFEVFIVVCGSAKHKRNNLTIDLVRGSVVLIRPDDIHQYSNSSDDFSFYNMVFSLDTASKLFSLYDESLIKEHFTNINIPPEINLSETDTLQIESNLDTAIGITNIKIRSFINLSILTTILSKIISYKSGKKKNYPNWLAQLINTMESDKNYLKGVSFLYETATRSKEHVSRTFRLELGLTPTEYINDQKLQYASNLLINTNIEIIEIGEMAGFNSHSHFYHLFQNKFKITPKQFRLSNTYFTK